MANETVLDMTMNFYLSSLLPNNVHNYIILATDAATCEFLHKHGVHCYAYTLDWFAHPSKDSLRKNIRNYMVLDALSLGYNVLYSDVDLHYFKNPFLGDWCRTSVCDVSPIWDGLGYNTGFVFVRNTPNARAMYKVMIATRQKVAADDQQAMNLAIMTISSG